VIIVGEEIVKKKNQKKQQQQQQTQKILVIQNKTWGEVLVKGIVISYQTNAGKTNHYTT